MSSPFTYHSTAAVTDRTWHICGTFYLCPPLGQESHHSWGQHCRRWVLISATGQGWLWVVRLALILVVFSGGGNDAGELDGWPILWAGKVRAEATLPPSTCRSAVETRGSHRSLVPRSLSSARRYFLFPIALFSGQLSGKVQPQIWQP